MWAECPFDGGYDLAVGTSDKGDARWAEPGYVLPPFAHLLLVFGGVEGLESLVTDDDELAAFDLEAEALFDEYVNLCPTQGSRTVRTEEALLVGLSALRPHIERAGGKQ